MKNLISMVAFVNLEFEELPKIPMQAQAMESLIKINNYAKFLSMPLELKMFVPCDEKSKVLISIDDKEKHFREHYDGGWWNEFVEYKIKFGKALSEVIFEGWKFDGKVKCIIDKDFNSIYFDSEKTKYYNGKDVFELTTIEDLVKLNLTLTPEAIQKYKF